MEVGVARGEGVGMEGGVEEEVEAEKGEG